MKLATARDLPIRRDLKFLNTVLNEDARVLMIGEAEVFDAHFDVVYNTVFDESIFQQWTGSEPGQETAAAPQTMKSATEIRRILAKNNITHLFVNWSEILRYRLTYGYTDYVFPQRFDRLQQMGIIDAPSPLSISVFSRLTDRQQQEVVSWRGSEGLIRPDGSWTSVQLFRVTKTVPLDERTP